MTLFLVSVATLKLIHKHFWITVREFCITKTRGVVRKFWAIVYNVQWCMKKWVLRIVNASFTFISFPSELEKCSNPITGIHVVPQNRQLFRGSWSGRFKMPHRTRQAMYVYCNIKVRSCLHCCIGNAISITYCVCLQPWVSSLQSAFTVLYYHLQLLLLYSIF